MCPSMAPQVKILKELTRAVVFVLGGAWYLFNKLGHSCGGHLPNITNKVVGRTCPPDMTVLTGHTWRTGQTTLTVATYHSLCSLKHK